MATKRSRRGASRPRSKAKARGARTKARSRRTAARRPSPRRTGPGPIRSGAARVGRHLVPRAADVLGVALVVLAVLSVMALWLGVGGLFGAVLEVSVKGLFGPVGHAAPVVAALWAILLLRGTPKETRGRMLVGLFLLTAGAVGIASLVGGNPTPMMGYEVVSRAGGLFGAVVAWPLSAVVTAYGTVVVCMGLAVIGLLVFTATPIAAVGRGIKRLFTGSRSGSAEEAGDEPAAARRRSRVRVARDDDGLVGVPAPMSPQDPEPAVLADPKQIKLPLAGRGSGYKLPPIELLRRAPVTETDTRDAEHTIAALERTFRTFGVAANVVEAHRGPTVTMFEVEVEAGTKVNKVLNLGDDIAYALATPDVRIIAPIPGKSAIGVEVPNKVRDFVMLGDILSSKAAKEALKPLFVGLGKDVHGRSVMVNLAEMPHLLIAGATGAGKSSLINTFVTSLLMRTDPDRVKLVLVDPKRVELSHFADIPHLISPVIVHPKRAAEALGWVVREMEMRYESFATVGMRDIESYNNAHAAGTLRIPPGRDADFQPVSYIVVVIDELADLMMVAPRDVEDAICRIAQMARAVGIHLVVATQRPSVDVVTGLIKANIPSRIAFMTASQADSRVILDVGGAEKLVGHGDMLFQPSSVSKGIRIQGAWVTEKEIEGVTDWCRKQRPAQFDVHIDGLGKPPAEDEDDLSSEDDLLEEAAELVIHSQLGSTSMLQRKLKVGFARAGRLMDLMEDRGIVGPSVGSKARDVLITWDEWEESRQRTSR